MDNLIFILYICLAIPLLLTFGILDKKARTVMGFLVIGMTLCMYVAQINGLLLQFAGGDTFYVTTSLTPITEEIIKALPILFYAFVISDDRQKLLTNAMAVGIGFAILENAYLAMSADSVSFTWALVRAFGAGLMHGICTTAVGLGLSFARQKKKLFVPGTFALLTAAITYHAIYNVLVQSEHVAYFGFLLPVATYIPFVILQAKMFKKQRLAKAAAAAAEIKEPEMETSNTENENE